MFIYWFLHDQNSLVSNYCYIIDSFSICFVRCFEFSSLLAIKFLRENIYLTTPDNEVTQTSPALFQIKPKNKPRYVTIVFSRPSLFLWIAMSTYLTRYQFYNSKQNSRFYIDKSVNICDQRRPLIL